MGPRHRLLRLYPCLFEWSHSVVSDFLQPGDLPGSSVHEIFLVRILVWAAISYSRGIFLTQGLKPHLSVSCTGRQILYHRATVEILRGNALSFSLLSIILAVGLPYIYGLYCVWGMFTLCPLSGEFYHKRILNFVKNIFWHLLRWSYGSYSSFC